MFLIEWDIIRADFSAMQEFFKEIYTFFLSCLAGVLTFSYFTEEIIFISVGAAIRKFPSPYFLSSDAVSEGQEVRIDISNGGLDSGKYLPGVKCLPQGKIFGWIYALKLNSNQVYHKRMGAAL